MGLRDRLAKNIYDLNKLNPSDMLKKEKKKSSIQVLGQFADLLHRGKQTTDC